MIAVKNRSDLFSRLNETYVRIKVPDEVVGFRHHGIDLVTQSQVYRKLRSGSPVVLNEKSVTFVLQVPREISSGDLRPIHVAAEVALQVQESDGTLRV